MPTPLTDPLVIASITAGTAGLVLLAQARVQSRLLRNRIAAGSGMGVVDAATGLFSSAAAWQCIRAEANRAARLERPLQVWVGAADDGTALDATGRELAFDMPAGARGVRIGDRHVCVLSCAGEAAAPTGLASELDWAARTIAPDEHAAAETLAFVAEVTGA